MTTIDIINLSLNKIEDFFVKFSQKKYWIFKATIILTIFSFISTSPNFDVLIPNSNGEKTIDLFWSGLNKKIESPLSPLNFSEVDSHSNKLEFRLTVPTIAYLLGLNIYGCLIMQYIFAILFFPIVISLTLSITNSKSSALICATSMALLFIGHWGFYDYFGTFDILAFCLMLLTMQSKKSYLIISFLLLAFFVDERALIASSLIFIWFRIKEKGIKTLSLKNFFQVKTYSKSVFFAWILYFITRTLLNLFYGLKTGTSDIGFDTLSKNFKFIPLGILLIWEGYWLIIFIAFLLLWYYKNHFIFFSLLISLFVIITVSYVVHDITRSLAYSIPLIFICLQIIKELDMTINFNKLLIITSILCLAIPTHDIIHEIGWKSPLFPKILKYL